MKDIIQENNKKQEELKEAASLQLMKDYVRNVII